VNNNESEKRVLICHYRVGWTDGVSLEIDKRKEVLMDMGWDVALLAGPGSQGADYIVPELDFDLPGIRRITSNAFGTLTDYGSEEALMEDIRAMADRVYEGIRAVADEWKPGFILLHNIFSHGRHIPAALSFYRLLSERRIPSLATHHDFYWERDDFREPVGPLVKEYLKKYVPPVIPGLRHGVINSLAARKLLLKKGLEAMVIPDTLDFSMSPWVKDDFNRDLPVHFGLSEDDILVLQATRIVRRKGIELIPPLIRKLNTPRFLNRLRGRTLYNGKTVTDRSRFVFVLAGYAEGEALAYRKQLEDMMIRLDVPYRFLDDRIAAERESGGAVPVYSLFDTYPYADLVSYPSQYEGYGNQFLEAVFARKPILVFEYPVFKADIKDRGYSVLNLGDRIEEGPDGLVQLPEEEEDRVCDEIIAALVSEETPAALDRNFTLARENNSFDYLRALMNRSMEHYEAP